MYPMKCSLDVEHIYGSKIEFRANKYTFVWRKTVETTRTKLMDKIRILLEQADEAIAQENSSKGTSVEFTPAMLSDKMCIRDRFRLPPFWPSNRFWGQCLKIQKSN